MEMDTNKYVCKAAGFYSLTPEDNDYITFMENSKKRNHCRNSKRIYNCESRFNNFFINR